MSTVIQSVTAEIIWACGEKAGQGQRPKTAELDLNSSSKVSIMVVTHRQKHIFARPFLEVPPNRWDTP
jgi:hypothetical protein